MQGIYHEQPLLDGWGNAGPFYDHRFMGLDQAPYRSIYLPAQPVGPYMPTAQPLPEDGLGDLPTEDFIPDDGLSSDEDDDDLDEDANLDVYSHVDLYKTLGQQLAVWCHRSPDTVAVFTPIPGDTLTTAVSFAKSALQCDPAMDRALILTPGLKRPLEHTDIHVAKPGSSILLVPKTDMVITVEIPQMDIKMDMEASVTATVRSLKTRLQRQRGFPVDRTDLLFQDRPMENQRHLFDYRVTHGETVFVMLHLVYDIKITVEAFWGLSYELYVDPCMTASALAHTVLRRTITQQAGEAASYFHLTLPHHALVLYTGEGRPLRWTSCLGLYDLEQGSVLNLSTVALAHKMSLQTVPVILPTGGGGGSKSHSFLLSKFDYWSVLALKLHGLLGYPINLMRMFHGKRELDPAKAVGPFSHKAGSAVTLDLSLLKTDADFQSGISLAFKLGGGMVEELQCSPSRTVNSVKVVLEELGVPNATAYDLFVDGYRLPNKSRIGDAVEESERTIRLKLRKYPIFVHGPNTVCKMTVRADEALKDFKARAYKKAGLAESDYIMLMSGLPIAGSDSSKVFFTPLTIRASVFLTPVQHNHTLMVVWDDWLVKLRLPCHPQASEIKNILWKNRNIPEGSLASLGNFLQWFFAIRSSDKDLLWGTMDKGGRMEDLQRSRSRRRRGHPDSKLWKYNAMQAQQLQNELEKQNGHHHGHHPHHHHHHQQQQPPYRDQEHDVYHSPHRQKLPRIKQARTKPTNATTANRNKEAPGVYYATHKDGRWQRINPEDLVDTYLRAWSLPPDLGQDSNRRLRAFYTHQRRKHHSAMPGLHRKAGQVGEKADGRKRDPQWVHSLQKMARLDRIEPAYAHHTRKKKGKKQRFVQIK